MPAVSIPPTSRSAARGQPLRIGFLDLIDAAPLIVALDRGFFADEGLTVSLERQLGWGSVRDRLTFGQLDAAHALLGMPLFSHLRKNQFLEPLVALMNLGSGGNAITLSRRLIDAGVRSAVSLAEYIRNDPRREAMAFGHVFSCSMHHYLLRDWLASAGIDPDRDVRLRVFPPSQLAGHMARGHVEGFCVGEPWNTLAQQSGAGQIAAITTDIIPGHPEKVLAVTQRWLGANEPQLVPMIRAILRGCAYCEDDRNRDALAQLLATPAYLNTTPELIRQSLLLDRSLARSSPSAVGVRRTDWRVRSFAPACTFPSKTHHAWLATEMSRWRQLPRDIDALSIAGQCADATAYRAAAASLAVGCPPNDFPPMALRNGAFDPKAGKVHVQAMEGASK
ncbi:MAG: CmpA/NrtA family ABC transporter substrate-binding protein [Tepidisphaeraceae bacterium]